MGHHLTGTEARRAGDEGKRTEGRRIGGVWVQVELAVGARSGRGWSSSGEGDDGLPGNGLVGDSDRVPVPVVPPMALDRVRDIPDDGHDEGIEGEGRGSAGDAVDLNVIPGNSRSPSPAYW